jgi:hypothetical protein
MKLSSVCLLVAFAVYVNAEQLESVVKSGLGTKTHGKGDITGSMREGWKKLTEMTGDQTMDEYPTTTTNGCPIVRMFNIIKSQKIVIKSLFSLKWSENTVIHLKNMK